MYIGTMQIYQDCGEHVGSFKITMAKIAKILNFGDVSIMFIKETIWNNKQTSFQGFHGPLFDNQGWGQL